MPKSFFIMLMSSGLAFPAYKTPVRMKYQGMLHHWENTGTAPPLEAKKQKKKSFPFSLAAKVRGVLATMPNQQVRHETKGVEI